MFSYIVNNEQDGQRLDIFLSRQMNLPRAQVQKLINQGLVQIDQVIITKSGFTLKEKMSIDVQMTEPISSDVLAYDFPLNVLYEDDYLLVVDKPAGLVVHPAPGHLNDTLVNALKARYGELPSSAGKERAGIVHRLDMDTSGLIVIAKTSETLGRLAQLFAEHQIDKYYIALVKGHPMNTKGRIEAPIGRDCANYQKMAIRQRGKEAITEYSVRQNLQNHSLLDIKLLTGRTHQIRVHLSAIGHPIYGDNLYGKSESNLNRQFLHASSVSFIHPQSKQHMSFYSPLPADLQSVLQNAEL